MFRTYITFPWPIEVGYSRVDTKPFIDYLNGKLNDALRISTDETRPIASRIVYTKEAQLLRDMIKYIQGE